MDKKIDIKLVRDAVIKIKKEIQNKRISLMMGLQLQKQLRESGPSGGIFGKLMP